MAVVFVKGRARVEPNDRACYAWPPRSPDLTPCDFYLWYFIKDPVYSLSVHKVLNYLYHFHIVETEKLLKKVYVLLEEKCSGHHLFQSSYPILAFLSMKVLILSLFKA
ncbi:hypothetical protein C0J52_26447 [Blattella germanica]|nr:hypothetical protein C0J52_26447 [Blattella germanica]